MQIISLETRRRLSIFKFFHKVIYNSIDCPFILNEINLSVPQYLMRNQTTYHEPFFNKNYLKNQPLIQFIKMVNNLPNMDIFFNSYNDFKREIVNE